ncbi:MAG: cytochrome c biosis protein transrane region [Acidimicrobiaceae bacterium]|nr:cytochrome c biosis protein transrane region [Acidimicrobiaceae bacterium]
MDAVGVSYVVAFGGGVISFVSPCVLPVVPAYLSMVTGLDLAEAQQGMRRQLGRVARDTLLFIAGFGAVFVMEGMVATAVGSAVTRDRVLLTRVSGGVVLAMSLFIAGSLVLRAPSLYGEARFHPKASRFGPLYAPIAGIAFGFGWTPCIGPVLASVLAVASTDRGVGQGALLLLLYTAGLGVPFLLVGLGLGRLTGAMVWLKVHSRAITVVSCVLLSGFGVLLVLNRLSWLTSEIEHAMTAIGLGRLVTVG